MLDSNKSNLQTNLLVASNSSKFGHYVEIEFYDGETVNFINCNLDYLFSEKDFINISFIDKEEVLVREYFNRSNIKNIRTEFLIRK